MGDDEAELRLVLKSCLENDSHARIRFQDLFGEFIYNYPQKIFHLSKDKAADFYIYVFESDRLFRRLKGFEGRNQAQFKTYLGFYVLRDLFFEWQRSQKEPETISLETKVKAGDSEAATLEDFIPDPGGNECLDGEGEDSPFKEVLAKLEPEKRTLLKLLHLAEFDLTPQEIRLLSQKAGRSYKEVLTIIEETRIALRGKDEQSAFLENQLDSIFGWILLYQKESAKLSAALNSLAQGSARHVQLCRQKEDLERKLEWRYRQRERMLTKARQFRVTTPYKDIARILNVPIGTICSLIARTRSDLLERFGRLEATKQATMP